MKRDHFLFLVVGALAGFITGYVFHESMAARQSPPAWSSAAPVPAAGAQRQAVQQRVNPNAGQSSAQAGTPGMAAMEQVQKLRAYVEANPLDGAAIRQLADLNYDISNWSRAAELYERFLKLEPDNVDALTDLGACYRNQGKAQEALEIFQRAKSLEPDHWQARYNEVLILAFDLGDLEAARSELDALQRQQPDNASIQRLAAEIERLENS